jgi:hypothetical protein
MGEVRVVVVVERELKWRRAVSQYCGRLGMHFCQARMRSVHKDAALQLAYDHCGRMSHVWIDAGGLEWHKGGGGGVGGMVGLMLRCGVAGDSPFGHRCGMNHFLQWRVGACPPWTRRQRGVIRYRTRTAMHVKFQRSCASESMMHIEVV